MPASFFASVAVTGLPNDQPIHAILMARFAWDCMLKMNSLVKQMERTLGPDTCDLAMRFGMHSGPVTAGVLRGDRPRFQVCHFLSRLGNTSNSLENVDSLLTFPPK
jgi:class 3 adenylate cyclase